MTGLRIAYLVSRYPAISHTFILREVRELRGLGFHIDVASINSPDRKASELTNEEREEASETFYVKKSGLIGALSANLAILFQNPIAYVHALWFALRLGGFDIKRVLYGFLYFVEAAIVARWMKARCIRHLHVHFATPAATVGMIVTHLMPVAFSLTVHGPDEFYNVDGYCLRQKIASAKLICAISDYARSQLMRLSPSTDWHKIQITRLGVDPKVFEPRPEPARDEVFEILCVGRLVAAKGQAVLLDSLRQLRTERRRVRLRYVGDGPDRRSLEVVTKAMDLQDCVVFEGSVNQDRIRDLYAAAHAFVLPSFAEGIPVVLMEAMAMEIPCITTWITGIPELIRHEVDGLLTAPGNPQALANAIAALIDNPDLARQLGRAGRARVIEAYNLRPSVEHLAAVFASHIGANA